MLISKFRINQFTLIFLVALFNSKAQNPLVIPPLLSGTSFSLTIQSGTKNFYAGYNTPTYGVNGTWLGPTLELNKKDSVTMNVTNSLNTSTTIHWHGLHVAPENDGGPHQIIAAGATWSPKFKVRNEAGTFWYHPHGQGKTDLHVSKGIAGLIIIRDSMEATINLPRTYGVDDIPLIVQSKAFDVLRQIAIATEDDTAMFVNGTLNPQVSLPAQVIRFRILNGSSMRSYSFGFTGSLPFKMIAGDGGLLDTALTLTQLRLAPGERAEVLLNLTGMNGQTIYFRNFGSLLPNGIYGAAAVGVGSAVIPGYNLNPRNGADYDILKINIIAQNGSPVTTMPATLTVNNPWLTSSAIANRRIEFNTLVAGDSTQMAEGPFLMGGKAFDMDTINIRTQLNNVEIWKLVNRTLIAHPFHMHNIQFYVLDINGVPPAAIEKGKKDVILLMPGDSLRFITKFEDFANDTLGYMYHCHLLHHEDDGMMGQFVVMNAPVGIKQFDETQTVVIYPNPAQGKLNIVAKEQGKLKVSVYNTLGELIFKSASNEKKLTINTEEWPKGLYTLMLIQNLKTSFKKIIIE